MQSNGNGALAAAADHAMVRTFTPLVVAALLGIVGWLFTTVMELEETVSQNVIHLQHLHIRYCFFVLVFIFNGTWHESRAAFA